jgi:YHS domain-containing protein
VCHTPGEIALSILAEIVQRRCHSERSEESAFGERSGSARHRDDTKAVDPVCGMSVERATAKHTLEVAGETYYFCCPHCKASFAKAHA